MTEKILSGVVFMIFSFSCFAQSIPCFDAVPKMSRGETEEIESNYMKTTITRFPTDFKPEIATDTIFTRDPETLEEDVEIVKYDKTLQRLDKAEIQKGDITYYYYKPENASCFRVYQIKEIVMK